MGSWNELILYIFVAEVAAILLFMLIIIVKKLLIINKKSIEDTEGEKISQIIRDGLKHKNSFDLNSSLKKFKGSHTLLKVLEKFEKRFSGDDWKEIRDQITSTNLLPTARVDAFSASWEKRNFAARCFVLTPLQEDENIIYNLVDDHVFLVRSVAAIALLGLNQKPGIIEIVSKMSMETGYARFFYRDLLLNDVNKTFGVIKELAQLGKNPSVHLACLELLSQRAIIKLPDYIKEDLNSKDAKIQLAALKMVARNPQKDSIELLIPKLNDENPDVRAEALSGLHYFPTDLVFQKLQEALKDPVWLVRLQAALALKKMGDKGLQILKEQNHNHNKNAYEVAEIVLKYGW